MADFQCVTLFAIFVAKLLIMSVIAHGLVLR